MKSDRPSPTCGRPQYSTGKKLPTHSGYFRSFHEEGAKILKFNFIIMIVIMIIG